MARSILTFLTVMTLSFITVFHTGNGTFGCKCFISIGIAERERKVS